MARAPPFACQVQDPAAATVAQPAAPRPAHLVRTHRMRRILPQLCQRFFQRFGICVCGVSVEPPPDLKRSTKVLSQTEKCMSVTAILAQDPHSRPATTDRSPAPFVHASDEQIELEFRAQYRAFVDAFAPAPSACATAHASWRRCFPCGLSACPAIQRPGLTGAGHHRADEAAGQVVKGKPCPSSPAHGRSTLPRLRSPSWPARRPPFSLRRSPAGRRFHPHQR